MTEFSFPNLNLDPNPIFFQMADVFPITAVLLSQYKSEQHHVIAENVYLLFGQKSIYLTIFNFHCTYLLLMDVRNIISFANIKKKNYLTRFDEI